MPILTRSIFAVVVLCSGCLPLLEPDVGEPVRERCVNEDSDPDTDVEYRSDIFEQIFRRGIDGVPGQGCRCHMPDEPSPIGFEQTGLNLSTYDGLRAGGANSGPGIVVPGQPCDSTIVKKISEGPPFGSRMPQDGPPYLTDAEILRIKDWIAEGALE